MAIKTFKIPISKIILPSYSKNLVVIGLQNCLMMKSIQHGIQNSCFYQATQVPMELQAYTYGLVYMRMIIKLAKPILIFQGLIHYLDNSMKPLSDIHGLKTTVMN